VRRITTEERRARLAARHGLAPAGKADDPVGVARSLVALHATDPATVYLSTWARTSSFAPSDLERSLYEEKRLVRVLGMRRTLFVVPVELLPVVHAACTRTIAVRERRRLEGFLADSGVARPDRWLHRASQAALAALDELGEASTSQIAAAAPLLATRLRVGAGTRFETTQSAAARLLPQLAMEGQVVRTRPRGSWTNGKHRWSATAAWLGDVIAELEPAAAQAELARRYLAAFGPVTETDLRWWAGWTAREARAALAATSHALVDVGGREALVLADDLEAVDPREPAAALLPTLDATVMGWKERDWYLGPHAETLFDRNGNAGPTVWWDGRVVGGWAQRPDGEIVFALLDDVGSDARAGIEREAERLQTWLGDVRVRPGFLPPFQRELAGERS